MSDATGDRSTVWIPSRMRYQDQVCRLGARHHINISPSPHSQDQWADVLLLGWRYGVSVTLRLHIRRPQLQPVRDLASPSPCYRSQHLTPSLNKTSVVVLALPVSIQKSLSRGPRSIHALPCPGTSRYCDWAALLGRQRPGMRRPQAEASRVHHSLPNNIRHTHSLPAWGQALPIPIQPGADQRERNQLLDPDHGRYPNALV